jgi:hypothetical protein
MNNSFTPGIINTYSYEVDYEKDASVYITSPTNRVAVNVTHKWADFIKENNICVNRIQLIESQLSGGKNFVIVQEIRVTSNEPIPIPIGFEGFNPGANRIALYIPYEVIEQESALSGLELSQDTLIQYEKDKKAKLGKDEGKLTVFAVGPGVFNYAPGDRVDLSKQGFERAILKAHPLVARIRNIESELTIAKKLLKDLLAKEPDKFNNYKKQVEETSLQVASTTNTIQRHETDLKKIYADNPGITDLGGCMIIEDFNVTGVWRNNN